MENKTKTINIKDICPEGYQLDKEKSTLDNLVFIRNENYASICEELFLNKETYFITNDGHVKIANPSSCFIKDKNNCTSIKQGRKLLAINMLLNVAKYLNDGWQPDWNNENENKYTIIIDKNNKNIVTNWCTTANKCIVYFKTEELAQKAIEILGEDTIKLALSTDW